MNALHEFIERELEHGKQREAIYYALLGQGRTVQAIDAAWKEVHARKSPISGVSILVILGAVLVGVGILSFVASNWEVMSNAVRIVILLVAMVSAYAGAWQLLQRGHQATGRAFVLLGSIIYGASIMLVGQMYHVQTNWTNAFSLWIIGVLAMTMYFVSLSHAVLASLLFFISNAVFAVEAMGRGLTSSAGVYVITDGSWVTMGITALCAAALWSAAWYLRLVATRARSALFTITPRARKWLGRFTQLFLVFAVGQSHVAVVHALDMLGVPDLVNYRVVGFVMMLVLFGAAYWVRGRLVAFFAILNLITWWCTAIIGPEASVSLVAVHGFIGLAILTLVALIVVGAAHRMVAKYRHFGSVFIGPALTLLLIFLTVISSSNVIMELWGNYGNRASILTSWSITFTYFLLITIVTGLLFVLSRVRRALSSTELLWLAVLGVFSLIVGTAGFSAVEGDSVGQFMRTGSTAFTTSGIVWAFVLNIVAFATMIWVAVVGYERHDRWRVTTAAIAIIIWVLARYFDWIFTYLDKSVGFVTLGVVLLAVGYGLERGRKKIIASFTHHHSA